MEKVQTDYINYFINSITGQILNNDNIIRIQKRKCPLCNTEFSVFGGLRSSPDGSPEWVMVCNNMQCNYEFITPVKHDSIMVDI